MPALTINTSRAKEVDVKIFDYDTLPLSVTYSDKSDPDNPVAIDLEDYKFEFFLKKENNVLKSYAIAAGVASNAHLEKTGDDNNILSMQAMWEDIRDAQIELGEKYRLIMVVTDNNSVPYAHIVFNINARNY